MIVERRYKRRIVRRPQILANKRLTASERATAEHLDRFPLPPWRRPRQRFDCQCGERPCPWVSCAWHLYCDVTSKGSLRITWPDLEPWEAPETCALDVADRGQHTLDEIGNLMNLSRERVRQLEFTALRKVKEQAAAMRAAAELERDE